MDVNGVEEGRLHFSYEWKPGIGPVLRIGRGSSRYAFCFCHHLPERSIPFFGLERYLCSRCLGVLLGWVLGLVLRLLGVQTSPPVTAAMILPLVLDGTTQGLGWRSSKNEIRLATGVLFGLAIAVGVA